MVDPRFQPDVRPHRDRMLAGDPYVTDDPDLKRESDRAAVLTAQYNAPAGGDAGRDRLLRDLLGSVGEGTVICLPFRCDYGYQTHVGARTFATWGLVVRDLPANVVAVGNPARVLRHL